MHRKPGSKTWKGRKVMGMDGPKYYQKSKVASGGSLLFFTEEYSERHT
jgi:hypothetical protein